MMLYGAWRFIIEFFRGDDRGATVVSFLTPSQLIAILMILGSIALFLGERHIENKWKRIAAINESEKEEL
jgi:prolipoprotein diacylglyceryltransferase